MIHKTTRSILSVLLAALLLVTSTPLTPAFAGEGGVSLQSESGESEGLEKVNGEYQIGSAEELRKFADKVNNGEIRASAVLTDDIDLNPDMEISEDGTVTNGKEPDRWIPIGNSSQQYRGTFDGDGHTISGLYIKSTADYQGLFGYVGIFGTVKDLSVSGSVSGGMYVGGVVGYNDEGRVENCHNTGEVSGSEYVGGVVGYNSSIGNVKNCYNTGTVTGTDDYVGGVVGENSGLSTVENCYNTGSVNGSEYVGGVVGDNHSGIVENCYNTGKVSGNSVGGVVGENRGTSIVKNCYNTGTVTGTDDYVGGVVGNNSNSSTVENCYNTGKVSGNRYVGGVVGYNSGYVTGCYFLQTTGVNESLQGIGGDEAIGATAESVNDLDALCENFEDTTTWSISPFYEHPVLKTNPEGGDGTKEHPYEIKTIDQLENFRDLVNGEDGQTADPDAHAKLMNNIDLSSVCSAEKDSWTPIGNSEESAYIGTFDGNGHTISGLYINNSTADNQGLFGYVSGTVQNLTVEGSVSSTVANSNDVGGIVGYNSSGTVTNCAFSGSGSVSGSDHVGGVVGYNGGSVTNCYNTGEVSGNRYVGGVVGYNDIGCSVTNSYNTGAVSGGEDVGGVVGYNHSDGSVTNSYNTGKVSGTGNRVGGVVGYSSGGSGGIDIVTGCYFLKTADVNSKLQGIGNDEDTEGATEKDDTAFHSGEVAWRLQDGQTAGSGQVWGQNLMNEPKDNYPQLRAFDADTPQVYKVAFISDNTEIEAEYANSGMTVDLPATEPTKEGYTFSYWQDKAGTQVTEPITVTADTEFTAQWTKDTVNYTVTVSADPEAGGTVSGSGEYSEGTQVTVTATPATGYHFVNWTENGTEVSTEATFTFNATVDRNLIAIFAKNEDPTPTPTPDPTPSGPSTGDSTGWDDILDELENTAKGDQITIDMGDETKVPAEIFESVAGKDVDVTFDLGDDLSWTVNGKDIPDDAALADLDLGVNLDTHGIPVNVINTITGEVGTVQITLAHDGEFGFTMTLTAPLGKENAGYWANLYHYKVNGGEADREDPLGDDERAEALNFEAAAKIDEDGSVKIPFSHASQYAIVIDTNSHATVDVSDLFIDVAPNAWYKDAVQYAYDQGLMTGVSATEFAPEQTTTRAMIVSILARLEGVESAQAAGFADVDDNDWYATAVNWAANVGVVNGYEDNTFRPNTAITREQLAAILMNYAVYKGEDVSNRADLTSYTDQPSTWAEETMQWAVAEGLISGMTNTELQPQGNATRAQVAAILQRFLLTRTVD